MCVCVCVCVCACVCGVGGGGGEGGVVWCDSLCSSACAHMLLCIAMGTLKKKITVTQWDFCIELK